MSFQTVSREAFSLYLLADALPLSLCPVCVFQSAEFFEMLEKMQVSILSVGVGGVGQGPGGSAAATSGHNARRNPSGKTQVLGGRAEKRARTVLRGLGHLRPLPREHTQDSGIAPA